MRWIDASTLSPETCWKARATTAQSEINDGKRLPKDAGNIWRETKPLLKVISHDKCWYCETREDRSDDCVDHFRPKEIYPWLTCEITNFRYACMFCNEIRIDHEKKCSGGKGNRFPLSSGLPATNVEEKDLENYTLLDPCVIADVTLLDFTSDGLAHAKYKMSPNRKLRAEESINTYHLNHTTLTEQRRILAVRLESLIKSANRSFEELDQTSIEKHQIFSDFTKEIGQMISSRSKFSTFARKILRGQTHDWISDVLEAAS